MSQFLKEWLVFLSLEWTPREEGRVWVKGRLQMVSAEGQSISIKTKHVRGSQGDTASQVLQPLNLELQPGLCGLFSEDREQIVLHLSLLFSTREILIPLRASNGIWEIR